MDNWFLVHIPLDQNCVLAFCRKELIIITIYNNNLPITAHSIIIILFAVIGRQVFQVGLRNTLKTAVEARLKRAFSFAWCARAQYSHLPTELLK